MIWCGICAKTGHSIQAKETGLRIKKLIDAFRDGQEKGENGEKKVRLVTLKIRLSFPGHKKLISEKRVRLVTLLLIFFLDALKLRKDASGHIDRDVSASLLTL